MKHVLYSSYSLLFSSDCVLLFSEYEKNGLPQNFVDQVFGGEMTSTIMCEQCKTVRSVSQNIKENMFYSYHQQLSLSHSHRCL